MSKQKKLSALGELLRLRGVTQAEFAHATLLGMAPVYYLMKDGVWPRRVTQRARLRVNNYLKSLGATDEQIAALHVPQTKLAPVRWNRTEADPQEAQEPYEEDPMLLQKESLTPEARKHFNLVRSPFVDDVQTPADVFQSPSVRYARAALTDCAMHNGFIALVGESGAGKSTLAEDLEERNRLEHKDIVVFRPYVQGMSENDSLGRTLKSGAIAESVIFALDPHASIRASAQARFRQIHELLKSSAQTGRRHLLLIEEAHDLPEATLKHLKRFLELKDGMRKLMGIALIGQPELRKRLSTQNSKVREVAQRCEIVELAPLNNDLEAYLAHKFARFDIKYPDVFADDAADAIRARLIYTPRGGTAADAISICHPQVVNNLVCRAMNAAANVGMDRVDAQVIAGC
ncbi:MAG: AAA family ATPase [Comamonas sp.]